MIDAIAILERVRALGANKTLADVNEAIAKRDINTRIAERITQKYRVELWDKVSPINGVPAERVLASYKDIRPDGEVYLIYVNGRLTYFQPHPPGEAGMRPMSRDEALSIADEHITLLATEEVEEEITRDVIEELLTT